MYDTEVKVVILIQWPFLLQQVLEKISIVMDFSSLEMS